MKEIAFIRGDWLEFAAALYPEKVLVYSYVVQVPDFPEANQGAVSVQPSENCKVPLLTRMRPAA